MPNSCTDSSDLETQTALAEPLTSVYIQPRIQELNEQACIRLRRCNIPVLRCIYIMRGASAAENAATQPAKIYFCGGIFLDILSKNNSNPNTDPNRPSQRLT